MPISPYKAIEILQINLKEAARTMPPDVRTTLQLSLETLQLLANERTIYGFTRVDILPSEQRTDPN